MTETITVLHENLKNLLENNIDLYLSDSSIKDLQKLDCFLQWMKSLGYK